jgi:hypothetical protein
VFWFSVQIFSVTSIVYEAMSEIWSEMYIDLHVKSPLFLSDFIKTWIFPTDFQKKSQIPHFMKIRPVGAELFHPDRRTDMMKVTLDFSQRCERALKRLKSSGLWHRVDWSITNDVPVKRIASIIRVKQSKHMSHNPEHEGITIFQNVHSCLPVGTYQHPAARSNWILSQHLCDKTEIINDNKNN